MINPARNYKEITKIRSFILFALTGVIYLILTTSFSSVEKRTLLLKNNSSWFDKIKISNVNWYNSKAPKKLATVNCENDSTNYNLAYIIPRKQIAQSNLLKGAVCVLEFTVQTANDADLVKMYDFAVDVMEYKPPGNCEPRIPMSVEKIDVFYAEIKKPLNGRSGRFKVSQRFINNSLDEFDYVKLEKGNPQIFRVRINSLDEGLYKIWFKLKVNSFDGNKSEEREMPVGEATWWYFKK